MIVETRFPVQKHDANHQSCKELDLSAAEINRFAIAVPALIFYRQSINSGAGRTPATQRCFAADPGGTLNAIKEDAPCWVELLKKIKVADVSSQNRATGSPGAYVQQSVVQSAPSLVFSVALESRQNAGKNPSFSPDVPVRHNHPLNRPPVDEGGNLFNDLACLQVIGIEQSASCSQLRFSDRGMPGAYSV